jgi:ABC-type antimicrobial peptide transport system permease subunit
LWKNKLRTFLSLFGVTIGIFCIIGVLATVQVWSTTSTGNKITRYQYYLH